jgi:hypothetical protein
MNKIEVQQRVLQNGKPLDLDKFSWDEKTRTFSTLEHGLVLDFTGIDGYTFITGSLCIFITRAHCTFIIGDNCTVDTGSYCTFKTGSYCTFKTGWRCTFITRINCVCVRRDVFEFFQIPVNTKIRLNDFGVKGFEVLEVKKLKFKIERIVEYETKEETQKLLKEGENIVSID